MTDVVSVRFRNRGKVYFFDPAGINVEGGQQVIVETSKGLEIGDCVEGNHPVPDESIIPPLRPVVRLATPDDLRVAEINKKREEEAFQIGLQKIAAHGLDMKLVDVECSFEGNKILFFFTSDGRVDFRELVKDLASVFRTRIELRQIGVRDEAKMLGGLGICGRPFCCSQFLDDFQPVSTKMAKAQSMSLNPAKISGTCGRLMCCLRYEQNAYEDLMKHVPKNGAFVQTPDGYGNVVLVNLLRQKVKVKLDSAGEPIFHTYDVDEIAEIPGGRPKTGEELPSVLVPKPKAPEPSEPEEEEEEKAWAMPILLGLPQPTEKPVEKPEALPAVGGLSYEHKPARRHKGKSKAQSQPDKAPEPTKPKSPFKRLGKASAATNKAPVAKAPDKANSKGAAQSKAAAEAPAKKKASRRRFGKRKPKQDS